MTAVTEDQPCVELPTSKEAISYRPFYGHFATTGETQQTPQFEAPATPTHTGVKHGGHAGHHGEHAVIEVQEAPAPKAEAPAAPQPQTPPPAAREPATPPTPSEPSVSGKTGGAAPP